MPMHIAVRLADLKGFSPRPLELIEKLWPELENDPELGANPYLLTKIVGIGWHLADHAAQEVFKIALDSPLPIEAGACHVLIEYGEKHGHTAMLPRDFAFRLSELLAFHFHDSESVPGNSVVFQDGLVSRRHTLNAEMAVAARLREMMARGRPSFDLHFDDAGLANDQRAALKLTRYCRCFVLGGGAGVGKTTSVRAVPGPTSPKTFPVAVLLISYNSFCWMPLPST